MSDQTFAYLDSATGLIQHIFITLISFMGKPNSVKILYKTSLQWLSEGGVGFQTPPEIPKALQNHAKLNPIVKAVKNY